jgi:DNA-binding NarL/FixJ family response regulator
LSEVTWQLEQKQQAPMQQLYIMLVASREILVAEVIARTITAVLNEALILTATSEEQVVEQVRTQPLALVIIDLDLVERRENANLFSTLSEEYPELPLLVCSTGLDFETLVARFGAERVVSVPELTANPEHLLSRVRLALQQAPLHPLQSVTGLSEAGGQLLEQPEAARLRVLVLCSHLLARSALSHTLSRLGVTVRAAEEDIEGLIPAAGANVGAQLIVGLVRDLAALQSAGRLLRLPVFVIALHGQELRELSAAEIAGVSLMLFDEAGDLLQLLAALRATAEGRPFLAVSPEILVAWTEAPDGLTPREWEVLIARVFTPNRAAAAKVTGLAVASVGTYDKRIRRKLGPLSEAELAALLLDHLAAQLGIRPEPLAVRS